jgi:hypothetical protein
MDPRPLSPPVVLARGGWHPAFARVLLVEQSLDLALVLVDGNGDGAEVEVEYWRHDGEWEELASSGYGPLDAIEPFSSWRPDGFVCALGRTGPGEAVIVDYAGSAHRRLANEFGLWGFIHDGRTETLDELPKPGSDQAG